MSAAPKFTRPEAVIYEEAEGFLISTFDDDREFMGGETYEEAINTADNMGFDVSAHRAALAKVSQ